MRYVQHSMRGAEEPGIGLRLFNIFIFPQRTAQFIELFLQLNAVPRAQECRTSRPIARAIQKTGTIGVRHLLFGSSMHIISRPLYEAALLISQPGTVYQPGKETHEAILAAGIARLNGKLIELTHKGEEVIRME